MLTTAVRIAIDPKRTVEAKLNLLSCWSLNPPAALLIRLIVHRRVITRRFDDLSLSCTDRRHTSTHSINRRRHRLTELSRESIGTNTSGTVVRILISSQCTRLTSGCLTNVLAVCEVDFLNVGERKTNSLSHIALIQ